MNARIRTIPDAGTIIIRTQDDLIEALRTAKSVRGLSNDFCDERGGMTRGHTDKVLGPTRAKSLSSGLFDTFAEMFAVQFIMVANPDAEARQKSKWEGRDSSNVRTSEHRVSKQVMERAKPHVLKESGRIGAAVRNSMLSPEHRTEIARKAARARWKGSSLKKTKKARQKRAWYRNRRDQEIVPTPAPIHPSP
jgi:hypothetical protein